MRKAGPGRAVRLLVVGVVLALASACAVLGGGDDKGGGVIKIGAVLSISGPAAPFGVPERDAAQAVIDEVNEEGGIDGREIELIVKDDKTNPTEAAKAAQELVDEGVVAIIGSTTGSATQAMAAVTSPAEVPIIGQNVTVGITDDWVFLATVGDEEILPAVFDTMVEAGHQRIAVFYQEDALGQYGSELFADLAASSPGTEIVATANAPLDATDVSAQATRLRNANPDAIFMAVSSTGLAASFLRGADAVGLEIPVYGDIPLAQNAIIEAAGPAAEGLIVPSNVDPSNPLDSQQQLYDLLAAQGVTPIGGFPDISGASSASMIIAALREAGPDADGAAIVKAWESGIEMETYTRVPGVFGPDKRHPHGTDVLVWVEVRDGAFREIAPTE